MRLYLFASLLSLAFATPTIHKQELEARAGSCKTPAVRTEWRRMKPADKLAYVKAEKCLMREPAKTSFEDVTSRFEELQAVHQILTPEVHQNSAFLPWHRYMLHIHEDVLRNECGYKGPMPWWDETLDRGKFDKSPLFTEEYFGTTPALNLKAQNIPCVEDGVSLHNMAGLRILM